MTPDQLRRIAEAAASVRTYTEEYAEFIATFKPKRVLELLDQIEQLQARLAAVEKLHYAIDDGACAHCDDLFKYPCPTIKAIKGDPK